MNEEEFRPRKSGIIEQGSVPADNEVTVREHADTLSEGEKSKPFFHTS